MSLTEFNMVMNFLTKFILITFGIIGLVGCWLWYLGTEKILMMREQRRMIKESRSTKSSALRTHYKPYPGHFDGNA